MSAARLPLRAFLRFSRKPRNSKRLPWMRSLAWMPSSAARTYAKVDLVGLRAVANFRFDHLAFRDPVNSSSLPAFNWYRAAVLPP